MKNTRSTVLSLLFTLAMLVGLLPLTAPSVRAHSYSGSGTMDDPWQINSPGYEDFDITLTQSGVYKNYDYYGGDKVVIDGTLTIDADVTLLLRAGELSAKAVVVNRGCTLTLLGADNDYDRSTLKASVSGAGRVVMQGGYCEILGTAGYTGYDYGFMAADGGDGGNGVACALTVCGGNLAVRGGAGGGRGAESRKGGNGGNGVTGAVTLAGGTLTVNGASGTDGGTDGAAYGDGASVTVAADLTYSDGEAYYAAGKITADISGKTLTPVTTVIKMNGETLEKGGETWAAEDGALKLTANGYYKLESDITIPNSIAVAGTVTLDLAGHVIDRGLAGKDAVTDGCVITVSGVLTLTDSSPAATHAEAVTYTDPTTQEPVTVSGGVVTGGKNNQDGGGVFVSGTFNMEGGTICGNVTADSSGGGVSVSGTFNMEGGTICGNTASGYGCGGGVRVDDDAFFTMSGTARIAGNTAYYGGGVDVTSKGTFTMTGGEISGNTPHRGGGVDNRGTFTLTGGEICGNTASDYGGGVYVDATGTLNLSGAPVVAGNTVDGKAENNVYLCEYGSPIAVAGELTGKAQSIGVTTEYGTGVFARGGEQNDELTGEDLARFFSDDAQYEPGLVNGSAELLTLWVALNAKLAIDGTITLDKDYRAAADDNPLTVPEGVNVTLDLNGHVIDRGLTDVEADYYVIEVAGALTLQDSKPDAAHLDDSDDSDAIYTYENAKGETVAVTGGVITGGADGGVYVKDKGTFIMTGGTICGNRASESGGGVGVTGNEASFTMSGGAICGNTAAYTGGGVGITGTEASFTMRGGEISSNTSGEGGGVYVNGNVSFAMSDTARITGNTAGDGGGVDVKSGGKFTMTGGEISGNTGYSYGGGVDVKINASFTMSGTARITGNTASYGGGVNVKDKGKFTMTGGEISGNISVDDLGGGVSVRSGSTFYLSGAPDVSDNTLSDGKTASNVYLGDDLPITVTGKLTGEAQSIGVTAEYGTGVFAQGVFAQGGEQNYKLTGKDLACFFSDDAQYEPVLVNDSAELLTPWNVLNAKLAIDGIEVKLEKDYLAETYDDPLTVPEGVSVTLDLNGHVIDRGLTEAKAGYYVIKVAGALTLQDSKSDAAHDTPVQYVDPLDSTKTVTVTGGVITGGANGVYVSGTFNMEGGTICGNRTLESGGGVYVSGASASFTMSGGAICGNTAAYTGGGVYAGCDFSLSGTARIDGNSANGRADDVTLVYWAEENVTVHMPRILVKGELSGAAAHPIRVRYYDYDDGVAAPASLPITDGLYGNGTAACFISADDTRSLRLNDNGDAELFVPQRIVIADGIKNGTVTAGVYGSSAIHAAEGDTVTLTVTPAADYYVDAVSYNDGSDHTIAPENGVYSFTMPDKDVTVSATFARRAAKIGDTEYPTLQAAFYNAQEGDTVTLLEDMTLTETLNIYRSLTLDLNGKTLTFATGSDETISGSYTPTLGGSGTIKGSDNISGDGASLVWSINSATGTLTISGTGAMMDYSSVSDRPWHAFRNSISSVILESGVTSVGLNAFNMCEALETVSLGASVASIAADDSGYLPFYECPKLAAVTVDSANTKYCNSNGDGVLYELNENGEPVTLLFCPRAKTGTLTVPATVTSFAVFSFNNGTSNDCTMSLSRIEFARTEAGEISASWAFNSYPGSCVLAAPEGLFIDNDKERDARLYGSRESKLTFRAKSEWEKLQEKLDAGGTVTLTRSLDYTKDSYECEVAPMETGFFGTLTIPADAVLDLGGYTLTADMVIAQGECIKRGTLNCMCLTNQQPSTGGGNKGSAPFSHTYTTLNLDFAVVNVSGELNWYGALSLVNSQAAFSGAVAFYPPESGAMLTLDDCSSLTLPQRSIPATQSSPERHVVLYFEKNEDAASTADALRLFLPEGCAFETTVVDSGQGSSYYVLSVRNADGAFPESVTFEYSEYAVTVTNGSGSGSYGTGETVTVTAGNAPEGKVFDKWTTSDGVSFADAASAETTFTMPNKPVTVTAAYRDIIYSVSCDFDGGRLTATVTAPKGSVLIAAAYESDGRPADVRIYAVTAAMNGETYTFDGLATGTGYTYKLMLADGSYVPLCPAAEVDG